jgi:hypothetical protein
MAGFSHAGDYHATGGRQAQLTGGNKGLIESLTELIDGAGFNVEDAARKRQQLFRRQFARH